MDFAFSQLIVHSGTLAILEKIIAKHQKSMAQHFPKHIDKKFRKLFQKAIHMDPGATQEGLKVKSKIQFSSKSKQKLGAWGFKERNENLWRAKYHRRP